MNGEVSKNKKALAGATAKAESSIQLIKEGKDMLTLANTQLSFQQTQLDIVDYHGQRWLQAVQIAKALGYANENAVSRIYSRNADEFTPCMTEKVKLTLSGNYQKEVRIFSLRGAHLLAMLSRTKVAKAFRKWVLDVLDKEVASAPSYSSKADRTPLKNAVNMLVGKTTNLNYADAYSLVHQRFSVNSVEELTVEQIPLAVEYVHKVILEGQLMDDMPQLPAPAISTIDLAGMEDLPPGRYLVYSEGGKFAIKKLGQVALVPIDHVSAFRRDMNQYMQYGAELLGRMRILHGEANMERLAEPLIR
ncbi:hypothetical protein GCM10022421_31970 [Oceanisphaera sediminis]|uniref:Bro-N domain-containing protein n=1 Tax=Oceanisphaera sediminis TaxID=981381 RepID=A0ABP7ENY1_9GAMM